MKKRFSNARFGQLSALVLLIGTVVSAQDTALPDETERQTNTLQAPRAFFEVIPDRIAVPAGQSKVVRFYRNLTFPENLEVLVTIDDPDGILNMPDETIVTFPNSQTSLEFEVGATLVSEEMLGAEARVYLIPQTPLLPIKEVRGELLIRIVSSETDQIGNAFESIPSQLVGNAVSAQVPDITSVPEAPDDLPLEADGYAGLYLDAGNELAVEKLELDEGERPTDAFILPPLEQVLKKIALNREEAYAKVETEIQNSLNEIFPDDDLDQLIEAQKDAEEEAIETAFASFYTLLPDKKRDDLQRVFQLYKQVEKDIKPFLEAHPEIKNLSDMARIYFEEGAASFLKQGCDKLFGQLTQVLKNFADEKGGLIGSIFGGPSVGKFSNYICDSVLPKLWEGSQPTEEPQRTLTGDIQYSDDPVADEWTKIFFTGEILGGSDRPDLPSDLDFFFRYKVTNSQQLLQKFPSQNSLHAALKDHLLALLEQYPNLKPYLDVTDANSQASKIWQTIYRFATEQLFRALKGTLEKAQKDIPRLDTFERLEQKAVEVAENPDEYGRVRIIRESPPQIGTVGIGSTIDITTRFAVISVAGDNETLTLQWSVTGPGLSSGPSKEEGFEFQFPANEIDPATDLTKTGQGTFSFDTSSGFKVGETYQVHVEFLEAGLAHTIPFTLTEETTSGTSSAEDNGNIGETGQGVRYLVSVEGSGFIPHLHGGSFITSGMHEEWIQLETDESLELKLWELRASYERDICEYKIPLIPSQDKTPIIWISGPQIKVVDGPITEPADTGQRELLNTWKVGQDNGPSLAQLKKERGCG